MPKSTQEFFWAKKKKIDFFRKKKSIFFPKIWIWEFLAKYHLSIDSQNHNNHSNSPLEPCRSIQERPGARRNIEKHSETLRSTQKHSEVLRSMKNHEKSWKIMENHGKSWKMRTTECHPPPQTASRGLQKTKKTEKSPQNVPKSSWNGSSTPPKHFGVAEIPYGTV